MDVVKKDEKGMTTFKDAFIIEKQVGEAIYKSLGELPMKYTQILMPILQAFEKASRGDVIVKEVKE